MSRCIDDQERLRPMSRCINDQKRLGPMSLCIDDQDIIMERRSNNYAYFKISLLETRVKNCIQAEQTAILSKHFLDFLCERFLYGGA